MLQTLRRTISSNTVLLFELRCDILLYELKQRVSFFLLWCAETIDRRCHRAAVRLPTGFRPASDRGSLKAFRRCNSNSQMR